MTDVQENKASMYVAVLSVLGEYAAVWGTIPAYVTAHDDFQASVDDIQQTQLIQEGNISGVTQDKTQARDQAIDAALPVASAVFAYASVTDNNALKSLVDYSPSELRRSRDSILANRLQIIHDAANDNIAALPDYGIDAPALADYQTIIDNYASTMQNPRVAISTRAAATQGLVGLFEETDRILKEQLDKLTEQFKTSDPVFYAKYHNARIIIDLGHRSQNDDSDDTQNGDNGNDGGNGDDGSGTDPENPTP